MLRSSVRLSAIVAVLGLTHLAACKVYMKGPEHASHGHAESRHGHAAPHGHAESRHGHAAPHGHEARHGHEAPRHGHEAPRHGHASRPAEGAGQGACAVHTGTGCYWMENTSGHYCWVPAHTADTFEECHAMDSCDGGKGQSNGGCYKWADGSTGERARWPAR